MGLEHKGISYIVEGRTADAVRQDLRIVAEELHCTTVMLIGTDTGAHIEAAECALEAGLDVYIRPSFPDRPRSRLLAHLAATAVAAEALRVRYPGRVTLLVGSEFSFTAPGMIPGPNTFVRLQILVRPRLLRLFERRITRRLGVLLAEALATARDAFHGPVTYAAGGWEKVDWSGFDVAGVNLYRLGTDFSAYERRLRSLLEDAGKPVVITEFGCGAHLGADSRGPGSFRIVKWLTETPHVKDGNTRDEPTQARYLAELIDLYAAHDLHGCFVFTFVMPSFPHHAEPRQDLDMAGFGVVKVPADAPDTWEPKEAFHEVARRYAAL